MSHKLFRGREGRFSWKHISAIYGRVFFNTSFRTMWHLFSNSHCRTVPFVIHVYNHAMIQLEKFHWTCKKQLWFLALVLVFDAELWQSIFSTPFLTFSFLLESFDPIIRPNRRWIFCGFFCSSSIPSFR